MAVYSDKELEERLLEAGNRLLQPPSSVDELLSLLDQIENCLSMVVQSPHESMHSALSPSLKALTADELLMHSNVHVKVSVASCISEITRISAPDAPYDDDQMKEVFQLIVSAFENLSDKSSRSYNKRTSILETVAKVRSCVVMLDLECDALIIEMFEHFLNSIRDYHPEIVFTSMETIMTLVLDESEDISLELLTPILASLKKDSEKFLPIARRLGEKVFENCATKIKPYLIEAVKSLGIVLDDYSEVVTSLCLENHGSVDQGDGNVSGENQVAVENVAEMDSHEEVDAAEDRSLKAVDVTEDSSLKAVDGAEDSSLKVVDAAEDSPLKAVISNGITQTVDGGSFLDSDSLKQLSKSENINASSKSEPDDGLDAGKIADSEAKMEQTSKRRRWKPNSVDSGSLTELSKSENINASSKSERDDGLEAGKVADMEQTSKGRGRKPNSVMKLTEPSDSSHIDSGKESEKLPDCPKSRSKEACNSNREDSSVDATAPLENEKEMALQVSSPKASDRGAGNIASPTGSGSGHDETSSRKVGRPKKRETINQLVRPSADVPKKTSEGASDSEVKPQRRSGKKGAAVIDEEGKSPPAITLGNSEAKPSKLSGKKVDSGTKNEDRSSARQQPGRKRQGGGKAPLLKDGEMLTSPKSAKSTKARTIMEETPKVNSKRKRTPEEEKVPDVKEFRENLVGSKIKVWWPVDQKYYDGVIDSFDPVEKKHKVLYTDGDEENLTLREEKWMFIEDKSLPAGEQVADRPSPDASSETHQKKKAKTSSDLSVKQSGIVSSRRGGVSSSKSKVSSARAGRKSRDDDKVDGKSKDDATKTIYKSEDMNSAKSKSHTAKSGSKSVDDTLKTSYNKSMDDDTDTPNTNNKSKQETPKTVSKPKGKASKTGSKSDVNSSIKMEYGSSKVKEKVDSKEKPQDSGRALGSEKETTTDSLKGLYSEVKSGKKRPRG